MRKTAVFGPGGNSESFYAAGYKSTTQAPEFLAKIGLGAYEFEAGNGLRATAATLQAIGEEAKKHGIALSLHAPYYISLSGVDPETRLKSVGYIEKSVHAAELLGADLIVIHTGSAAKITREEAMDYARDTLCRALETIDTPVRFGLETMGKINQLGTLEEVIELCKLSPRLRPVVDFGHLNARHLGNFFVTEDDYRRVFDAIGSSLGDDCAKTLHCHFSKIEYTAGGEKKHLTFADTHYGPEPAPLMRLIRERNLSPTFICESDGTQAEDAAMLKALYESEETV
jgi:deoxyribonuclease-4